MTSKCVVPCTFSVGVFMLVLSLCRASLGAKPETVANSIGMKLVLIPAGEFMMGSGESAEETAKYFNDKYSWKLKADYFTDERQHRVRITRPFYLGAHHVTVGQFRQFVQDADYKTEAEKDGQGGWGFDVVTGKLEGRKPQYTWRNTGFERTDEHPVVNVTWNDAVAFCDWLSRKEGKTYRLPTEAQWEYACRAGTTTRYYGGDDPETLAQAGNVADATFKTRFLGWKEAINASDGYTFTAPVRQFRPNAFGLYDMHGNAWQWCADWYGAGYGDASQFNDPTGPALGSYRVYRGGSWLGVPWYCRSASRIFDSAEFRGYALGFRVCLVAAEK